jgi:hypothetical protein
MGGTVRADDVTWFAIDAEGKTHHVTPEDVMGATLELVEDARVLQELIARLMDHDDPEVKRSLLWACQQIDRLDRTHTTGRLPPESQTLTVHAHRPHRALVFAFGISALIGAITAIGWVFSLVDRI